MDVLVLVPMKDAANCGKQSDLQNSESDSIFERVLHSASNFAEHVWFNIPKLNLLLYQTIWT